MTGRNAALLIALLSALALQGCEDPSPWVQIDPDQKVYGMLDLPLQKLHEDTEAYLGTVFEGRFKFYHIYRDAEDADPARRGQVIAGETHFTARPVLQHTKAIQILITPEQEAWIRAQGIERQDAVRARIRFTGIAPGSALAFELLEILEVPGKKKTT